MRCTTAGRVVRPAACRPHYPARSHRCTGRLTWLAGLADNRFSPSQPDRSWLVGGLGVLARLRVLRWILKRAAVEAGVAASHLNGSADAAATDEHPDAHTTAELRASRKHRLGEVYHAYHRLLLAGRETTAEGVGLQQAIKELHEQREQQHRSGFTASQLGGGYLLATTDQFDLKADLASMPLPIFSLTTKPDMSVHKWQSRDGKQSVEIIPSVKGRATQHDKDVLIYCISQLIDALNLGRIHGAQRTVRFIAHRFFAATQRGGSKHDYDWLWGALERLAGTRITTDIATGGQRIRGGFGIIDSWRVVEKDDGSPGMAAVDVTLSEWLWNSVRSFEVLTLDPQYFDLRKGLAKRLYEIARKHCGRQRTWCIGLATLRTKAGSRAELKEFRRMVADIAADDNLPTYSMHLVKNHGLQDSQVVFTRRETPAAAKT